MKISDTEGAAARDGAEVMRAGLARTTYGTVFLMLAAALLDYSFINFCMEDTVPDFLVGVYLGVVLREPATEPARDPASEVAFDLKVFTFLKEFMPERW